MVTTKYAAAAANRVKDLDDPFAVYDVELTFTSPLLATLGATKDWLGDYVRTLMSGHSNPVLASLHDLGEIDEAAILEFYEKKNVFPVDADGAPCVKASQFRSAIYEATNRLGIPGRSGYMAEVIKSLEMPSLIRLDDCVIDHFSRPISTGGPGRNGGTGALFQAQMAKAGATCRFTCGLLKQNNLNDELFRKLWALTGRIIGLGPSKMRNDGWGRFTIDRLELTNHN